jgi:dTDP-4-amino-4,6-dideoxygalactose transaminase
MDTTTAIKRVSDYLTEFLLDPTAFRGQQMRGGGPVEEFEQELAVRCGFPYCVATCNATTALLGLAAMFRVRERTVWFPASHWEGSVSAFRLMSARIRRYDPIGNAPLLDCDQSSIVIVPELADVDQVRQRADSSKCTIVEDSSRLPGCTTGSRSKAEIQILSFGPGKPLCLGEGGAILFRSKKLYRSFLSLSMHPERLAAENDGIPKVPQICLNARIHPVAALIGAAVLAEQNTNATNDPVHP